MFSIETDLDSAIEVAIALTSCALGVFLIQESLPLSSIAMVTAFTIHRESVDAAISLSGLEKEMNSLRCDDRDAFDFSRYHLRALCGHSVLFGSS